MRARCLVVLCLSVVAAARAAAQSDSAARGYTAAECPSCAEWNAAQRPLRIFGNTYWVGPKGLGSILITSDHGHILIDGALPESAPSILASVRALGFRVEDIKLILNSHAHYDHAGGIAALQRASGAEVAASPWSAKVLRRGFPDDHDPQYGIALAYPPVRAVRTIRDGETLHVGSLAVTAHFTGGHTPGGTTWTWRSCERERCLDLVYADSQTPVSADDFQFTRNHTYTTALQDFAHSAVVLEGLRCDILITPHPGASSLWDRVAARDAGNPNALVDSTACRRYAADARAALAKRVAAEGARP